MSRRLAEPERIAPASWWPWTPFRNVALAVSLAAVAIISPPATTTSRARPADESALPTTRTNPSQQPSVILTPTRDVSFTIDDSQSPPVVDRVDDVGAGVPSVYNNDEQPRDKVALLDFNAPVVRPGFRLVRAELRLYVDSANFTPDQPTRSLWAVANGESWDHSTMGGGPVPAPRGTRTPWSPARRDPGWTSWDVTEHVRGWLAGEPSFGLRVMPSPHMISDHYYYNVSSAEGGRPPELELEFSAPSPYIWPRGPSPAHDYFPLAVWLQSPSNAAAYQDVGINTYIGLWEGPRDDQLDALTAAGMHVMPDQNATGLERLTDSIITGWIQQDEPDNAQSDGMGGWGPCVEPGEVIARYQAMKAADPSRPVFLNLGQNVAWDHDNPYIGRGSECSERWDQYPEYVKGADIVAFDIYPVTSEYDEIRGNLWRVALGVDRLREWTNGEKIVWNVIETAHINSTVRPTASQIESEVWMSLIHGSMGIVYFAHEWYPEFREPALLHYPDIREGVRAINAEITELAPVLNSETLPDAIRVEPARADVPVDVMAKWHEGATYIFAVAMRDGSTDATFRFQEEVAGLVEVIGENRTIALVAGEFHDTFGGYEVHKYRVVTSTPPASNAIYLSALRRQDGLPTK